MSDLTIYEHLEQGSDEWLEARRGIVTASTVGRILTPQFRPSFSKAAIDYALTLAVERMTGRVEPAYQTRDMERGTLLEPHARWEYEAYAGVDVAEIGMMKTELADGVELGYSPDGLVGDAGLIEIKSRKPHIHVRHVIDGRVPNENYAQLQAGLLVSGRGWIDYVSYSPGLPLWVTRIPRDEGVIDAIVNATIGMESYIKSFTEQFEEAVKGMPETEWFDPFEEEEIRI